MIVYLAAYSNAAKVSFFFKKKIFFLQNRDQASALTEAKKGL
jgi:hypothetical protein